MFWRETNLCCEEFLYDLLCIQLWKILLLGSVLLGDCAWLMILSNFSSRPAFIFFSPKTDIFLEVKLYWQRSSGPSLDVLSWFNALRMNYLAFGENLYLLTMVSILSFYIFFNSYFQFLALQGVSLVSISKKMIPIAQISVLKEYQFLFSDSGAIYKGEPTLYLLGRRTSSAFIPKPKSAIFRQSVSVIRRFAGFRSRWINFFS